MAVFPGRVYSLVNTVIVKRFRGVVDELCGWLSELKVRFIDCMTILPSDGSGFRGSLWRGSMPIHGAYQVVGCFLDGGGGQGRGVGGGGRPGE